MKAFESIETQSKHSIAAGNTHQSLQSRGVQPSFAVENQSIQVKPPFVSQAVGSEHFY